MPGKPRPPLRLRAGAAAIAVLVASAAPGCGVSSNVSRAVGARCADVDECDERCLEGRSYPGGFCGVSCDNDGDCPDDAACADVEGGVCLFECRDAAGCEFLGDGWRCGSAPARAGSGAAVMVCEGPS